MSLLSRVWQIASPALLVGLFGVGVVSAQTLSTETFISEDGAFQMEVPSDWVVVERPDNALELTGPGEEYLTIFTPNHLAVTDLFATDVSSADSLLVAFQEQAIAEDTLAFGPTTKVPLSGSMAFRSDFTFGEKMGAERVSDTQFMLAVPVDNRFALITALGPADEAFPAAVYALADSFVILDDTVPDPGSENAPSGAMGLPTDAETLISILEAGGYVSGDGELIWTHDFMTTSVGGPFVLPEESESDYPNIAAGTIVSFRPDTDERICGLVARYNDAPGSEQFLLVGLDADYNLIVIDAAPENASEPNINGEESDLSFFNPQQLIYVLRDNRVTVFINGEPVIEGLAVALTEPNARGIAPSGSAGAVLEFSCVMTDTWVYGFRD